MAGGFLHKYYLSNGGKALHKWVHYFDIYERHLERFRGTSPTMLEIGVSAGGSLEMWKAYLGPGTRLVGVDIVPECKQHESDGVEVFIGSQDDPALLRAITAAYPKIDIVLDDGSHVMQHMISTFEQLYDKVSPQGVYMVEDTHTCYWPEYGGGMRAPRSFMEFAKRKLDELNAVHTRGVLPVSTFTRTTDAVCFYDSVVVFERRPQGVRQSPVTAGM